MRKWHTQNYLEVAHTKLTRSGTHKTTSQWHTQNYLAVAHTKLPRSGTHKTTSQWHTQNYLAVAHTCYGPRHEKAEQDPIKRTHRITIVCGLYTPFHTHPQGREELEDTDNTAHDEVDSDIWLTGTFVMVDAACKSHWFFTVTAKHKISCVEVTIKTQQHYTCYFINRSWYSL